MKKGLPQIKKVADEKSKNDCVTLLNFVKDCKGM